MSRLTELLRRVEHQDPALAGELAGEVKALASRRVFGLNFERHVPETFELPGRTVRRGDKVRFRAPRGESDKGLDASTWQVTRIERRDGARTAHLIANQATDAPKSAERSTDDLVVVAEYRDPIYPGLISSGKVERGGDKPWHTVINGENYHALEALLFAYEGAVDCIYIDPPYNTRDKDWKYNNDYVDSDDAYRHSKWLAMMERRLRLAKRLLNPEDSVLIVTIDEKEYLRLGMLLEQAFSGCRIQMVSSVIAPQGSQRSREFSRIDEYLFFVFVGEAAIIPSSSSMIVTSTEVDIGRKTSTIWDSLIRRGTSASRRDRPTMFYPVWVDPSTGKIVKVGEALASSMELAEWQNPHPSWIACLPIRTDGSEGRWQISPQSLRDAVREGTARAGSFRMSGTPAIMYMKSGVVKALRSGQLVARASSGIDRPDYEWVEQTEKASPRTVWNQPSHNASVYGSTLLRTLLPGRKFPFPKSLYAIEDALRFFVKDKPEAVILDFFAGSGTTAHAVMRLNRQDGGRRRSIMVTNNEVSDDEARVLRRQGRRPGDPEWEALGICEYITKPRIRAAITGQTPGSEPIRGDYKFTDEFPMADGFAENAEFFDLTYEDPERVRHDLAFAAIAPLLWMRAGSVGRRIETPSDTFDVSETYGVLFNLDAAAGFVQAVMRSPCLRVVYIVTDDETQYQIIANELPRTVQTVRLYESYLRRFHMSAGEG